MYGAIGVTGVQLNSNFAVLKKMEIFVLNLSGQNIDGISGRKHTNEKE